MIKCTVSGCGKEHEDIGGGDECSQGAGCASELQRVKDMPEWSKELLVERYGGTYVDTDVVLACHYGSEYDGNVYVGHSEYFNTLSLGSANMCDECIAIWVKLGHLVYLCDYMDDAPREAETDEPIAEKVARLREALKEYDEREKAAPTPADKDLADWFNSPKQTPPPEWP